MWHVGKFSPESLWPMNSQRICSTGGEGSGMMGISLVLVEKSRPGVSVRAMDCMGVKGSGTAFVEFDDV